MSVDYLILSLCVSFEQHRKVWIMGQDITFIFSTGYIFHDFLQTDANEEMYLDTIADTLQNMRGLLTVEIYCTS